MPQVVWKGCIKKLRKGALKKDRPPAFGLKAAGAASLRIIMFLPFIRLQTGGCSRFMQVTETGIGLYIILLLKFPKNGRINY